MFHKKRSMEVNTLFWFTFCCLLHNLMLILKGYFTLSVHQLGI